MAYKAPKGTKDVTPEESYRWQYLEHTIRKIVRKYGLLEARTPCIEHTELFLRGVGDTTDIVQKEMYTFTDKGDRSITLKPEGTAGAVRMFVENGLYSEAQPTKMYYLYCPVFRYERPQAGRLREHHQFGVEIFGSPSPAADAEVISIASEIFETLGCSDLTIKLNSIGCPKCRGRYQQALKEYLASRYDELCETCKTRFETNPLRILDCKVDTCKEIVKDAPHTMDYVCDDCRAHMNELMRLLDLAGIRYEIDPMLVRGLDYYTKTVFEIIMQAGREGLALCGGGRYDGLVEQLGGPATPAAGFGIGAERILMELRNQNLLPEMPSTTDVYVANLGADMKIPAFTLTQALRNQGVRADCDLAGRSLKAQFKFADKIGAKHVVIVGGEEYERGVVKLRNMESKEETELPLAAAAEEIAKTIS